MNNQLSSFQSPVLGKPGNSIPALSPLRAPAPPREPFSTPSVFSVHSVVNNSAFSLIELLVVIAIMATMVGLSAVAVQGFRAPAVQQAADQVMSGLSLARQTAITKNTQAAFLVATATGIGLPSEPFRHWSVVYSNKGANTWTLAKDWEALPNGAVFSDFRSSSTTPEYKMIGNNTFSISPGDNITPAKFATGNVTMAFSVVAGNSTFSFTAPYIIFRSSGSASEAAIRVAPGTVMGGNATLTSTNQYYFVETDPRTGRIRMRSPQSYR
jgi:prepilin-type N-terminal cleavage/methylation domain-containing protein